jgi:hypothetical protein
MKTETVIYFIVTFFFSLLLMSSAFEVCSFLPPPLHIPLMILGILAGMILPAMIFVFIDEMIEKHDDRSEK